jgi:hypothetical protein
MNASANPIHSSFVRKIERRGEVISSGSCTMGKLSFASSTQFRRRNVFRHSITKNRISEKPDHSSAGRTHGRQ